MENSEKLATGHTIRRTTQHCTQTNISNANKTWALLQTTGGKDEPNFVFMRKSQRTLQYGTPTLLLGWSHRYKILPSSSQSGWPFISNDNGSFHCLRRCFISSILSRLLPDL